MRLAFAVLRGDRGGRVAAALAAVGTAAGVLLALWLLTAPGALDAREARAAWRTPPAGATPGPLAVAVTRDEFDGRLIERFDVASTTAGEVAVAAGIPRRPRPGEVLLSPALAELVRTVPADRLGDRFPGAVVGELGPEALRFPDELVAIVGHRVGEVEGVPRRDLVGSTAVSGVGSGMPRLLTEVGLVVLVVPCLALVAAVGRLTEAARARRFAALRLAGATPGQVVRLTAVEAAVGALAGSALGVALSVPASRLAARVPWGGGAWFPEDFVPDPVTALVVAVLSAALLVGAAVLGHLRQLARPPAPPADQRVTARRLLFALAAAGVFALGLVHAQQAAGPQRFTVVLVGVGGVVVALVLVGPVATGLVGRALLRCRRGPLGLLVGRRLASRPVASFRASAGVLVAVFTGALALTMLPTLEEQVRFDDGTWRPGAVVARGVDPPARVDAVRREAGAPVVPMTTALVVSGGRAHQAVVGRCAEVATVLAGLVCAPGPAVYAPGPLEGPARLHDRRDRSDVDLPPGVPVRPSGGPVAVVDPELAPSVAARPDTAVVRTTPENRDAVRTVLARVLPGIALLDRGSTDGLAVTVLGDLRRAVVVGLVLAASLGGVGASVAAAGSVLDRGRTFAALVAAGTSKRLLRRALCAEVLLPVCAVTLAACGAGVAVGIGLLSVTPGIPDGARAQVTPWLAVPVAAGAVVALAAAVTSGSVLRRVTAVEQPGE
ncbi:FtsX-like permease family protein [Saccharothrix australiensis]|uniref:FtsX-like permease family protein n=1 Tax=Saccharothrix australiensis TaxID=2072 RepID=A0A495VWR5_9PSEU|nr:FtsX-like permease family protein [Saccharothrix australiensis]RKT53746.1 FtsX-like permease family protein [Saccharothrix australiensis]